MRKCISIDTMAEAMKSMDKGEIKKKKKWLWNCM
jgi:hypothetical protein